MLFFMEIYIRKYIMQIPPGLVVKDQSLQGDSVIYLEVYVDDVLVTSADQEKISQLKAFLHDKFKIKDLGNLHYFLGLEVLYKPDGVIISQRNALSSPLDPNEMLKAKEDKPLEDFTSYRKLIDWSVRAFYDSDWDSCPYSRRFVSGYIGLLGNSHLSWKSKKQETISLSSAEAEYRLLRKVVGECSG
ncbi:uncharacterized mitochondrial protein AtMg00810-like [Nicotiana sylvestris]|uniref:uncharacterized mitochondrial protein AtMg00810-like n=1 Tax=Nicotiana sylvestris TaxID=4096 RepID=UPI00388C4DAA